MDPLTSLHLKHLKHLKHDVKPLPTSSWWLVGRAVFNYSISANLGKRGVPQRHAYEGAYGVAQRGGQYAGHQGAGPALGCCHAGDG